MLEKRWGRWLTAALPLLLISAAMLAAEANQGRGLSAVQDQILRYVRERYAMPPNVTLAATPLTPSALAGFYQTTILVNGGKRKQPAFVTQDGKYLIFGNIFRPGPDILAFVRRQFKVPANDTLSLAPLRDAGPEFYEETILVNGGRQQQVTYLTRNREYLIFGKVYLLADDPRLQVEREINLQNQPSVGPADAPVTIVEYADLECPLCARMHQFLATQLLPKYGSRVRVVFKEFPLVQIHQWALSGAIADQCVYEINPADVLAFRTQVFGSQSLINAADARALLLDFGQRVGVDRLKLATCMDSKATLPRVEASMREGQELGVNSTPTLFINGQKLVGLPPPATFFAILDHALATAR